MSLGDEYRLLATIPPFEVLDIARLKLLAFASDRLTYQAGQILVRQGDVGRHVYVILEGMADVHIDSGNGPRHVRVMDQHTCIGEIAVLDDVPRTATVIAKTDVEALKITSDVLFRMIADEPKLADAIDLHRAKTDYVFE